MSNIFKLLTIKNILIGLGIGAASVGVVASVGYQKLYFESLPKFEPNAHFVYAFPEGQTTEISSGEKLVGSSNPSSDVQIALYPKNDTIGITETVRADAKGYWELTIPDNIPSGGYNLTVEDNTYDVDITNPTSLPLPSPSPSPSPTPFPGSISTPTPQPQPTSFPSTTSFPTPICDDSQIYCQDNIKIWKHAGSWDGGDCSYVYDEIGSCDEETPTASSTPSPTTPAFSPTPAPSPDPSCSGDSYYCLFHFVVKQISVWEDDQCRVETQFVLDSKEKRVKCSCPKPITGGICPLSSHQSRS